MGTGMGVGMDVAMGLDRGGGGSGRGDCRGDPRGGIEGVGSKRGNLRGVWGGGRLHTPSGAEALLGGLLSRHATSVRRGFRVLLRIDPLQCATRPTHVQSLSRPVNGERYFLRAFGCCHFLEACGRLLCPYFLKAVGHKGGCAAQERSQ